MGCGDDDCYVLAGRLDVRLVEGLSVRVELGLELVLRPEYGLGRPLLQLADGGAVTRGGVGLITAASDLDRVAP